MKKKTGGASSVLSSPRQDDINSNQPLSLNSDGGEVNMGSEGFASGDGGSPTRSPRPQMEKPKEVYSYKFLAE